MPATILPVAKAIYLSDYHFGYDNGKADLYGVFHEIVPDAYPHVQRRFCVYAQLVRGLGRIPFFVDVVHAATGRLIRTSHTNFLKFVTREIVIQVALTMEGCVFEEPGLYLVELYCDNTCIGDVSLRLV